MKRLNVALLSGSLALVCLPACAAPRPTAYDYARVVHANPVYETVRFPVDEQVCWEEEVWQQSRPSAAPVVLGAIIGGVVGHQFGGGNGKTALTVAGAAVGGTIGHQVAKETYRGGAYPVLQTRCEVQRNWRTEQRVVAWDVTYKYHGNLYQTRMAEQPGRKIPVQVNGRNAPYYR